MYQEKTNKQGYLLREKLQTQWEMVTPLTKTISMGRKMIFVS